MKFCFTQVGPTLVERHDDEDDPQAQETHEPSEINDAF